MIHIIDKLAATSSCDLPGFFSLPTWYKYLKVKPEPDPITEKCEVQFHLMNGGVFNGGDMLLIGLAIVDILIRIAALVAVAFVLYGGIKYITSQGSPEGIKAAQNTILNAVIGLVIAILAATIVAFIGRTVS